MQPAGGEVLALDLYIPSNTPISLIKLFMKKTTTNLVENSYFIPVPCCTRINSITPMPQPAFSFDTPNTAARGGWDNGKWAVSIPAETFD